MKQCPFNFKTLHEVKIVLSEPSFTVRPKSAPIPKEIEASCAGAIFASLVRMRDDSQHDKLKMAVIQALDFFTEREIYQTTLIVEEILYKKKEINSAELLTLFNYALPICVIGYFISIHHSEWETLVIKSREFFDCIISNGDKQKIIELIVASEYLYAQVENVSGILLT
ncbi:hypothetical protein [Xenorhabdus miraniensis]|uniref:Uncharacterized protein n=1 Tax=Xenorhabdus miraniensis TaxID=351674 RepID=A0A2D0JKJ4_9GAMM|nr:hypothetical protein [Xenorhabdus miraniensis]PHM46807.1 hypothetical protein Xmir_03847 [Xenorhabdus miraniensis]